MSPGNDYETWLNARRNESPPDGLTDRVMSAVRESEMRPTVSRMDEAAESLGRRVLRWSVCSTAAVVLMARLYSMVSLFVVAPSETELVMHESVEELHNVHKP